MVILEDRGKVWKKNFPSSNTDFSKDNNNSWCKKDMYAEEHKKQPKISTVCFVLEIGLK